MSVFLVLAFRNLLRHKRRSLLTGMMICVGAIMAILAFSFIKTVKTNMTTSAINACAGNIQIHAATNEKIDIFYPAQDEAPLLTKTNEISRLVARQPGVSIVVPRLRFGGLFSCSDTESKYGVITAIDPLIEPKLTTGLKVIEGTYLTSPYGILLGEITAKTLHAKIGQEIILTVSNEDGMINRHPFTVQGIVSHQGMEMFLNYMNYIDINTARQMLHLNADEAFELAVALKKGYTEEKIADSLNSVLINSNYRLRVDPWWKVLGIYYSIVAGVQVIPQVMLLILLIVIALGIINTVTMAVLERTREIGTMLALGTKLCGVRRLFLLEMGLLGAIASGIGCLIGTAIIIWFGRTGIPVTVEALEFYLGGKRFYFIFDSIGTVVSFFGIVLISILASYISTGMIGRLKPIEALRQS